MQKSALVVVTTLLTACSGSFGPDDLVRYGAAGGPSLLENGSTTESSSGDGGPAGSTDGGGEDAPGAGPSIDPDRHEAMIAVRLTDAPGDFEAVPVTISRIEAHYLGASESVDAEEPGAEEGADGGSLEEPADEEAPEGATEETGSWVTLVDEAQAFDLLTLQNGVSAALGDALIEPGQYDQIRLIVSEASVVVDGETHDLDIPSGEQTGFKLSYDYEVVSGGSYELMLDFDAHESIRQRGNGQYALQPVITVAYFGAPQIHTDDLGEEDEEDGDTGSWDDEDEGADTGFEDTGF
jgi:hypothetical protein